MYQLYRIPGAHVLHHFGELRKSTTDSIELQDLKELGENIFFACVKQNNVTLYVYSSTFQNPQGYGSIYWVTQQGLNDVMTQHYLHSRNHRNLEALKQELDKRNWRREIV